MRKGKDGRSNIGNRYIYISYYYFAPSADKADELGKQIGESKSRTHQFLYRYALLATKSQQVYGSLKNGWNIIIKFIIQSSILSKTFSALQESIDGF